MWDTLLAELDRPAPRPVLNAVDDPSDPLAVELNRLEQVAAVRRTQDLPVHAVLAGWKGELAAWRGETQRNARFRGAAETLPAFGWFDESAEGWWDGEGNALDPTTVDLVELPSTLAWVGAVMEDVDTLVLSPLPEADELTDPSVRVGLSVVCDAVQIAGNRAVDALRAALTAGFVDALRAALDAWYENRGAAGLAVVDEMRRHIEYAAARRHFVGVLPEAIEQATTRWANDPTQPHETLARLAPLMESVAQKK